MAESLITLSIEKGSEWERVLTALDTVDSQLAGQFREKIKEVVEPLTRRARSEVETMPVKGHGFTGLRHEVGRGLSITETVGAPGEFEILVEGRMPASDPSNEGIIPLGMDRPTGWRHPVFGHMDRWVQQVPLEHGWFTDTFDESKGQDNISQGLQEALDWACDLIDNAGAG